MLSLDADLGRRNSLIGPRAPLPQSTMEYEDTTHTRSSSDEWCMDGLLPSEEWCMDGLLPSCTRLARRSHHPLHAAAASAPSGRRARVLPEQQPPRDDDNTPTTAGGTA